MKRKKLNTFLGKEIIIIFNPEYYKELKGVLYSRNEFNGWYYVRTSDGSNSFNFRADQIVSVKEVLRDAEDVNA